MPALEEAGRARERAVDLAGADVGVDADVVLAGREVVGHAAKVHAVERRAVGHEALHVRGVGRVRRSETLLAPAERLARDAEEDAVEALAVGGQRDREAALEHVAVAATTLEPDALGLVVDDGTLEDAAVRVHTVQGAAAHARVGLTTIARLAGPGTRPRSSA